MEDEKFVIQKGYKKAAHKRSLLPMEEKPSKSKNVKKLSNKYKKEFKEFDDMDSLTFLKDVTERRKLKEMDERIKLLKMELKSLLNDEKSVKDCKFFANNKSDLINVDEISEVTPKVLDSDHKKPSEFCKESHISSIKNFKPSTSFKPSKFSEWLDKAIDEMDLKPETEEKNMINVNSTPFNSKLQLHCTETSQNLTSDFKSKNSKVSLLPQDEIEKLLYKSFVMQNSEVYLSSSEDSYQDHIKSTREAKQHKCRRSRKQCKKSNTERLLQSNLNKNCRFSEKGQKRRLINRNSFLNEVKIIDLDNSLVNKEMPETNYEVLEVDNYDWNEPFDVDIVSPSDIETVDNFNKNNMKRNDQDLKFNDTEIIENNQSVGNIEGSTACNKKHIWECPVCFDQSKGQEVVATQCGHIFCKKCIENHSSKLGKNCPSCRSDLRDKPLITLFNF